MIAVWLATAGWGQQACDTPFSRIQLGAEVGEVGDALAENDLVDAQKHINAVRERMPCLDEVADLHLFALFARYQAVVYFYGQQEAQATRWGAASKLAEPELGWDEKLFPADHPARQWIDAAAVPPVAVVPDRGLLAPRGGGVFANGRFLPRPEAPDDLPTLVQVFDRSRQRVDGGWQDGHRFPERFLTDSAGDLVPPAWLVGGAPLPAPIAKPTKPARPPGDSDFPVVPIGVTVALAAVSGGTYALASSWSGQLSDAENPKQLETARNKTNLMVVTSGVSLAGAVGVGIGGVLLSGGF
ncbi:MAG: hypothetical protein ABMA64_28805 [Myxococcota bacterium]